MSEELSHLEILANKYEKLKDAKSTMQPDEYDRSARKMRRQIREEKKRADNPTVPGSPEAKKATKAPRTTGRRKTKKVVKQAVATNEVREEVLKLFKDSFAQIGLVEVESLLKEDLPYHMFDMFSVADKRANNIEVTPESLLKRFNDKWLVDPDKFVVTYQGDVPLLGLGPVTKQ